MTTRDRTLGPAHVPPALFELDVHGQIEQPALPDLAAFRAALVVAGDSCQAVAATARLVAGPEIGGAVAWHFNSLCSKISARIYTLDKAIDGDPRALVDLDVIQRLLSNVQTDLDHWRGNRSCPPAGIVGRRS